MTITVRQSAFAESNGAYPTYGASYAQSPAQGNLLVCVAQERAGETNFVMNSGGWTLAVSDYLSAADSTYRKSHAVWWKIAGPSEPTAVSINLTTGNAPVVIGVVEFESDAGEFAGIALGAAVANGVNAAATVISTGTTASVAGGDKFLVGCCYTKVGGSEDNPFTVWDQGADILSNFASYDGGNNGIDVAWATGTATGTGTHEAASRSPDGDSSDRGGIASLLVFTLGSGGSTTLDRGTETDTARPVAASKAATAAQGPEADTARPLAPAKSSSALQGSETDTALAVSTGKAVTLALTTETDTALAVGTSAAASVTLALATETDTALAAGQTKTVTLGIATEADTARPATIVVAGSADLGLAPETDTARPATAAKTVVLALATEADTTPAATTTKAAALDLAAEADTAYAVSGSAQLALALAAETDAALAVLLVGDLLDHAPRATVQLDPATGSASLDPATGAAALDQPTGVAALNPATASVSLD